MAPRNEIWVIILGILMLFGMHILATIAIFLIGLIFVYTVSNYYNAISIWAIYAYGFLFWQLLYVIPVVLLLKRRQQRGLMKGVIIGAVITALLNGGCFLLLNR